MSDEAALRQIFERLGHIDARLAAGSQRHDEFKTELKDIKKSIEPLPIIVTAVEGMKPIVKDYETSRNKMAGIFIACSAIAGGVGFFASELKAMFFGR